MQSVIKDVTANMPQCTVTYADGQPRKILESSNAALHHVRTDAEGLLRSFKHLKNSKPKGFWKRLQEMRHRCKFAFEGSTIRELILVVQGAKSNLQLALEIALLSRNVSG
jgi:hypothetical protein